MKRTLSPSSSANQHDPTLLKQPKITADIDDDASYNKHSHALLTMLSNDRYEQLRETHYNDNQNSEDEEDECKESREERKISTASASTSEKALVTRFFSETWQMHPVLFRQRQVKKHQHSNSSSISNSISNCNTESNQCQNFLDEVISMGWNGVTRMFEQSTIYNQKEAPSSYHHLQPLILQNQQPLKPNDIQRTYSSNQFIYASYLDGCSIIQNHADYFSIPLSNLCNDLQSSFPHCYCNTYLTPPNSSTVKAHADDRDVFVVQIKGKKRWRVYRKVPIPYPYNHEQVGKNDLPIPFGVMNDVQTLHDQNATTTTTTELSSSKTSTTLIDTILEEGDILYMPRGYVHEASTSQCNNQPSFHATIAIMTSDWTYSKTIADMTRKCLDEIPEYRMAINVNVGTRTSTHNNNDSVSGEEAILHQQEGIKKEVQTKLESIFQRMQECITMESISHELHDKYKLHNQNSHLMRKRLYINEENEMKNFQKSKNGGSTSNIVVGPKASKFITLESKVRASTPEERESVTTVGERGLTVREEISDVLLSIVATMKGNMDSVYTVANLRDMIHLRNENSGLEGLGGSATRNASIICDFTLISFVKCCVSLGAMSIVH